MDFPSGRFGTADYGGSLYGVNPAWQPFEGVRWDLTAHLPKTSVPLTDMAGAAGIKATFRLREPSTLEWTMRGGDPAAQEIVELGTDVMAWRNGVRLARYRVAPTTDDLDEDRHSISYGAFDYRGVLARRAVIGGGMSWTGVDQAQIAWDMVGWAQNTMLVAGGDMGISRGLGQTTGRTRDRNYEPGKKIGQAIDELANVIDGFDWDVSPDLTLDIYYPARGVTRDFVAHYGATVSRLRRVVDPGDYANAVRFSGGDGTTAVVAIAPDIAERREGRWDAQVGDPDITVQATVNERAPSTLVELDDIRPSYTATLTAGAWNGPATLWLGDTCRLVARSGRLDVDTSARVVEIAVEVGDDGGETVAVTFDRPAPSLLRRLAAAPNRLTNLEKR